MKEQTIFKSQETADTKATVTNLSHLTRVTQAERGVPSKLVRDSDIVTNIC